MNMLKLVYQLQGIEAAELAVAEAKRNSAEYKDLRAIRAAFESKKQQYLRLGEDLKQLTAQVDAFPGKIAESQARLDDEKSAIYDGSVVNSKALAAREAQALALEDKLAELKALEAACRGELEQKQAAYDQLHEEMEQQYADFRGIKSSFQVQEEERRQQLAELAEQKAAVEAQIDEDTLSWYRRERGRFNGSPVAMLSDSHVCSGCHTMVPPIAFKRSQHKQRIVCERCGRVLFIDEE